MFFPESNLWNQATINEHAVDQPKSNTDTSFSLVQSVYDKEEWMDINAELGLSFMGNEICALSQLTNPQFSDGQIEVKGSAGYMSDKVEAKTQVNPIKCYDKRHSSLLFRLIWH